MNNSKPIREIQCKLNPHIKEVVQKEVVKLIDAGIIYHISNSQVVSIPKKSDITVARNSVEQLVHTRETICWRVCIDYKNLNFMTGKYHFPLSFINQIPGRLAGQCFCGFLEIYFGYNQVDVYLKDQEKITFKCPTGSFANKRMPLGCIMRLSLLRDA